VAFGAAPARCLTSRTWRHRVGELLELFKNERARTDLHTGTVTQTKAARDAGMSKRQKDTPIPHRQRECAHQRREPAPGALSGSV
jgi:hypothetical protein